jgi:cyclophilin family peptidyl-prolyl cis-trans isomerase
MKSKKKRFVVFFLFILTASLVWISPNTAMAERVRMITNLGNIDVVLFDEITPITVANFRNYVNAGKYQNTLIHRSVPGFVIQGGGYFLGGRIIYAVEKNAPIVNEFHLSNLRGTIAMAKLAENPDSATSEWFFNLADNSENLDSQNGGFTVFGRVTDQSLAVIDAIAALTAYNASTYLGSAFTNLPLLNAQLSPENLVMISDMVYAGDLDNDKSVDLADAVRGLQIGAGMGGNAPTLHAEINHDGRIGIEEVVHILQKLSQFRSDSP